MATTTKAKTAQSSGTTVYFASLAFHVPRNGAVVNDVAINSDYPALVQTLLDNFGYYATTKFELVEAKVSPTDPKKYKLRVGHPSWPAPFEISLTAGKGWLTRLVRHCARHACKGDETLIEIFRRDNFLDSSDGITVQEGTFLVPNPVQQSNASPPPPASSPQAVKRKKV